MSTPDWARDLVSLSAKETALAEAVVELGRAQAFAAEVFRDNVSTAEGSTQLVGLQAALDQLGATLQRWDSSTERMRLPERRVPAIEPSNAGHRNRETVK